ncbi:MAG: hypothetical protein GFH27_549349n69 [Chloroflexi bacterium AL-W]|nr:hypothetical protein [Chloroflexi bacterium AL-N1]NOK69967.1 hypothetical protein [Chloroflexi bacterium AL-N10]NOK73735.1 hypothetical protein [Chloroflexi bacterium AL-N5]NOK85499.1 hypothetical protein [Chloroflexi bacterium AL-W]NOK91700.1 hypothetical protein [Chloroflexi bacterium AL-N15]
MSIAPSVARSYLVRNLDQHLALLGMLDYEAVQAIYGIEHRDILTGIAIVSNPLAMLTDNPPTIAFSIAEEHALPELLQQRDWPKPSIWSTHQPHILAQLETWLESRHDPARGALYYIAPTLQPSQAHPLVRRLTWEDADQLDLSRCSLKATTLRHWMRRGWRIFGAVDGSTLLSYAMAAYPIGDTEEVASVFTAPHVRGHGLARAVVTATVSDIQSRGMRAIYATKKTNLASQGVAMGLGMRLRLETWEILATMPNTL